MVPAAGAKLAENDLQQCGLPQTVPPDDAELARIVELKRKALEELRSTPFGAQVLEFQDRRSKLVCGRNDKIHILRALHFRFAGHLEVLLKSAFGFRSPRTRTFAHPFEFALEKAPALAVLGVQLSLTLGLVDQEVRVVAGVRVAHAVGELDDPVRDGIQEVPVVRDEQAGRRPCVEERFDPFDGFGVQMVRGLVEKQEVGSGDDRLAECNAPALTAGERQDVPLLVRNVQRMHRRLDPVLEIPPVAVLDQVLEDVPAFGGVGEGFILTQEVEYIVSAFKDVLVHIQCRVQCGILGKIPDHGVPAERDGSAVGLVQSRDDLEERGFPGSVVADQPDLVVLVDAQRGAVQDNLFCECDFNGMCRQENGALLRGHAADQLRCCHSGYEEYRSRARWHV